MAAQQEREQEPLQSDEHSEQPEQPDQPERPEQPEQPERPDQPDQPEQQGRQETKCVAQPAIPLQPMPQEQQAIDERFMRMALDEARAAAEEGEVPCGAIVVYDGEVVARAHNRREGDADPSAHAEFRAMLEAARALQRWRLTGCTVYVTLEPCLMCAGLMVNARIDRCVFGATDPKGGALGTLYDVSHDPRLNHEFEVTPGVLVDDCANELRQFFRARRKKK